MIKVDVPVPTWPAYLKTIQEEVRDGAGIFAEDDQLRTLFEECFARGNALTGAVLWGEGCSESFLDSDPVSDE